ncbi:23S rRNA methyltransferase RlmD [Marinibacterium anthonyi]|nr:23S rRNA methyltransferase RlmD [Marinibacterium anthonyi]
MSQTERHRIERLGHQGDGIAPGPVYVPRTLPGEVVEGRREGDRLVDARIVEPSGDRVAAPCPHYKACGGCALQHASDGFVAGWKLDVVRHALQAQGVETEFRDVITSPAQSRRRATVAVRRTKKGAMAGFYGRASDVITEIPNCRLLAPELIAGLATAEALARVGASRKGALAVTMTATRNGLDVSARGGKELDGPLRIELAGLAQDCDLARLAWEDETVATRMPPEQVFGGVPVTPPPGAFLQATREGEAALLAAVDEITTGAKRIADLFCGSGTFTLPLAHRAEVHGVEAVPEMLAALDRGWRHAQGLRRVATEARDLFRRPLMADELRRFDAVVIDPPRAGAQAQTEAIADARVPVVAAVSCNPVTFARDARCLTEAGYRLRWVQVVDQFRWSTHVELAAAFSLSH